MLTITSNNKDYKVEIIKDEFYLNGQSISIDAIQMKDTNFHVLKNEKSFDVDLIKINKEDKTITLKVNGNKYELKISDQFDELLKNLGMDVLSTKKVNQVKAPMPGLVLSIVVEEGSSVKKGDPLLILEAMKMENILKSPVDGTIKKIAVTKGVPVEKNQLLIEF